MTQLALMRAFLTQGVESVTGVSFPGSSSRDNPQRIKRGKKTRVAPEITIQELPFVALGLFQPFSQAIVSLWHYLRTPTRDRPDAILVSEAFARTVIPSILAARAWRIPVVIIATGLSPASTAKSLSHRFRLWIRAMIVRHAPGVVVFSAHLGRDLRPGRPWVRMVRPPALDLLNLTYVPPSSDTHIIYYAGGSSEVGGADLYLQSIQYVQDPTYRFWFSGRGPLDETIRESAQRDSRITHWGFVSREKYCELLQQANVLVNPRPTRLPANRYNFPSKLMEYMAAARPIISTATADVGEHYSDAIVLLEDETPKGLGRLAQRVSRLPAKEQTALGLRALQCVQGQTWETQARLILDFMNALRR